MKKSLALLIAFSLALGTTACGNATVETQDSAAAETEESALSGIPAEAAEDVIAYLTDGAICAEDVLYTVNGQDITAQEFFYWITYEQYLYQSSYYSAYYTYPDFSQEYSDGDTLADYVLQDAYSNAVINAAGYALALADGVELSEENQNYCNTYILDYATTLGESLWEEALAAGTVSSDATEEEQEAWIAEKGALEMLVYLMSYATTEAGLQQIYVENYYLTQYKHDLYDEGGIYEVTEEDVAAYIEENGILSCHYILVSAEDYTDADANAEAAAELYAQAEEIYNVLCALSGEELEEAIAEYAAENPDGNDTGELVFYDSDTMLDGFRESVEAMEVGEWYITELTDYGYFVVLKEEVTSDTPVLAGSATTVLDEIISNEYQTLMNSWYADAEVTDYGLMDAFDVLDFFEKLEALRETLDEVSFY